MKKYEEYKDSGVEWIGKIPKHWEVKRLKNIAKIVLGKMLCNEDKGNYLYKPYLKSKNIQWLNVNIDSVDSMWFSKYEIIQYQLKKGDLILSEGGEVGKVCIWENELNECYIQNSVHKVTVDKNNLSKFFLFLLFTAGKINFFESIVNKVSIGHLTKDKLINIYLPIAPLQEQKAIADFLDDKCAKVDALVSVKEQQIALLKERRQAVIHQAVTKGLDSNVECKDSGIEWIGDIPKHWEVKRLKFVAEEIKEKLSSKDSNMIYYGMENIESWSGKYIITNSEVEGLANRFIKGSILFGKLRPYLAKVHLTEIGGLCSSEFIVLIAKSINNRYLKQLMISPLFIELINSSTYGAKMPRANTSYIINQIIPIPPIAEQEAIVKYLEAQTSKIDQAIVQKQEQILKLKEYKRSLINEVVTGKVKVS